MNKILASLAVLILTTWAAPASAVVIFAIPGPFTLTQASPSISGPIDATGFNNIQISLFAVASSNTEPCGSGGAADCLSVAVNGSTVLGPATVPKVLTSFGPLPLGPGASNTIFNLAFNASFSAGNEWFKIGKIVITGDKIVPEPGTLALIGFGLMGLGVARRRRKTA